MAQTNETPTPAGSPDVTAAQDAPVNRNPARHPHRMLNILGRGLLAVLAIKGGADTGAAAINAFNVQNNPNRGPVAAATFHGTDPIAISTTQIENPGFVDLEKKYNLKITISPYVKFDSSDVSKLGSVLASLPPSLLDRKMVQRPTITIGSQDAFQTVPGTVQLTDDEIRYSDSSESDRLAIIGEFTYNKIESDDTKIGSTIADILGPNFRPDYFKINSGSAAYNPTINEYIKNAFFPDPNDFPDINRVPINLAPLYSMGWETFNGILPLTDPGVSSTASKEEMEKTKAWQIYTALRDQVYGGWEKPSAKVEDSRLAGLESEFKLKIVAADAVLTTGDITELKSILESFPPSFFDRRIVDRPEIVISGMDMPIPEVVQIMLEDLRNYKTSEKARLAIVHELVRNKISFDEIGINNDISDILIQAKVAFNDNAQIDVSGIDPVIAQYVQEALVNYEPNSPMWVGSTSIGLSTVYFEGWDKFKEIMRFTDPGADSSLSEDQLHSTNAWKLYDAIRQDIYNSWEAPSSS
jgi:hypothetical protein